MIIEIPWIDFRPLRNLEFVRINSNRALCT